ncbi:MFS transporter [Tropicimonas sp. IMCC6043]|uniref:MFS transporter n=1 Tax=Tropicimonas sp. IMCC6043 TaxID=2510645 RepID=UPI00101C4309|nr:MFS transporter [Tropicimonas sp. IMCC6043]RYH10882.1 MFS transporter [Tropicimonas sp. IMCC6043]
MLAFIRDNAAWLAAGFLLTFTSSYGQTYFISIFAGEIRADFGLSHGSWGAIYALGTLASAITMLWTGTLADRFRVRGLALFVLPFLAAACLAMAAVPYVWALPLVVYALRLGGQGMTTHIAIVAMGRWFVAGRGKALSVAALGFTIAESLLPIVFVALMGPVGWRALWVLAAFMVLAVIPVLLILLQRERVPSADAEINISAGMDGRHWRRGEMLQHWLFWAMLPLMAGPSACITSLFFHQVHVAEIKEISHLAFVAMFPIFTATSVAMMVLSGFALDRFGTARLLPFLPLPIAAGFLVLGTTGSIAGIAFGMALIGLSMGANSTVPNAFWAEFYGTRNLGAIKSVATAVMVFGSAVGPVLTGGLIDAGVGFQFQLQMMGVYFLVTAGIVTLAMRRAGRLLAPAGEVDIVGA